MWAVVGEWSSDDNLDFILYSVGDFDIRWSIGVRVCSHERFFLLIDQLHSSPH